MKFCEKCGNELNDGAVVCLNCGCPAESKEDEAEYEYVEEKKDKSSNFSVESIVAMVMGIVGCVFPFIGMVVATLFGSIVGVFIGMTCLALCIAGLVLAIKARKKNKKDGFALAALISSIVGIAVSTFLTAFYIIITIIMIAIVALVILVYIGIIVFYIFMVLGLFL